MASRESYLNMLHTSIRIPLRKLFTSNAAIKNSLNQNIAVTTGITQSAAMTTGILQSGAITTGLAITGTVSKGIDVTDATLTQGWGNGFFTCGSGNGSGGDQHSVTTTGFYIPIQVNMASIANPSAPSHFTCAMFRVDVTTAHQAYTLANPIAIRGDIAKNVYGIEGINCDIAITAAIAVSTGVNSGYFCLSGDGAITNTFENQVVLATYRGTSGSSGIDHVLAAHMNAPNCSVTNLLFLSNYQGTVTTAIKVSGTVSYMFDFTGTSGAENTCYEDDQHEATDIEGKIMIKDADGTKAYINVWRTAN